MILFNIIVTLDHGVLGVNSFQTSNSLFLQSLKPDVLGPILNTTRSRYQWLFRIYILYVLILWMRERKVTEQRASGLNPES